MYLTESYSARSEIPSFLDAHISILAAAENTEVSLNQMLQLFKRSLCGWMLQPSDLSEELAEYSSSTLSAFSLEWFPGVESLSFQ